MVKKDIEHLNEWTEKLNQTGRPHIFFVDNALILWLLVSDEKFICVIGDKETKIEVESLDHWTDWVVT